MKKLKLKPKSGQRDAIKMHMKSLDHSYIFLVPNDKDGKLFYKLCRKYIDKRYMVKRRGNHSDRAGLYEKLGKKPTAMMDVPIKHAENWRVYIEWNINKKEQRRHHDIRRLSFHLFNILKRARDAKLVDLIQELQKEFKTKSINESSAVKRLMERLLASYIAGKFKGKYE